MKIFFSITLFLGLFFSTVFADSQFYYWTDENGIKNFSQDPPPAEEADSVEKVSEIPYDQETDARRMKEDERWLNKEYKTAEKNAAERKAKQEAELEAAKREEERAKAEKKKQEVIVIKKKKKKARIYINPGGTVQPEPLPAGIAPKTTE